ncbi:hypothetical protein ABZ135_07920 [Streptomyces sp. NPDC006339]|uniref:hypothetical protein n=1 Tax=Streptomyces sp. NPDC006339 TaxID=3156755 RepID=UPI0033AC1833
MKPLTAPVPRPPAPDTDRPRTIGFRPPRAALWPAALAALFTLAQLALVVPGTGLGWDEAVYVSQVGGNAPPAFFSAPRARGITYLVAPVAALTASTTAIRVYLALLSGTALFGALWIWRRVVPVPVLTTAGALFASLWITLFYGPRVMPNLWCAFGALAAVGCFLRAVTTTRPRTALLGLGAAGCAVALLRPAEGLWLTAPLLAAALLVPAWRRRPAVFPALLAGPLLGALPWIAEAYAHYGGLAARLRRAGEIQGSLGWYLSVDDHVRALSGRTLCRPCDVPWEHPVTALWWFVLPLAVAAGIAAAFRAGRGAPAVLATVTALSLAAPYLFTIGYAAPRFLLPAYALLALPAAEALVALVRRVRPARRPAVLGLLTGLLLGHLAVQYAVLSGATANSRSARTHFTAIATALHAQGVRPPCLVSGKEYVPVGYHAGCTSRAVGGHDAAITPAGVTAAARRMPVAVLVPAGATPPAYARDWRPVRLPAEPGWDRFDAYVSTGAGAGAGA